MSDIKEKFDDGDFCEIHTDLIRSKEQVCNLMGSDDFLSMLEKMGATLIKFENIDRPTDEEMKHLVEALLKHD